MMHSDKDETRTDVGGFDYLGENLCKGITGEGCVKMWYDEIKDTDNGGGGTVKEFNKKTGHYTQVVWKATTTLGCGELGDLVVCQYGPGGNSGGYAENVLPPTKSEEDCKCGGGPQPEGEGPSGEGGETAAAPEEGGEEGGEAAPAPEEGGEEGGEAAPAPEEEAAGRR